MNNISNINCNINCNICNEKLLQQKNEEFFKCKKCFHIQKFIEKKIESNSNDDFYILSLFLLLRYYYINKNIKTKTKLLIITDFIDKSQFVLLEKLKTMLKNIGSFNNIYPTIINFRSLENDQDEKFYETYDIVLIQNFNKCENPAKIMNLISNNFYIFINTKKYNTNGIKDDDNNYFNSNSMKLLCEKNNLCLNLVLHNGNDYFFEITKENTLDSNLIDELYNEIVDGIYDN